jgi:hypothetical protein
VDERKSKKDFDFLSLSAGVEREGKSGRVMIAFCFTKKKNRKIQMFSSTSATADEKKNSIKETSQSGEIFPSLYPDNIN